MSTKEELKQRIKEKALQKVSILGIECFVRRVTFNEMEKMASAEDERQILSNDHLELIAGALLDENNDPIFTVEELRNEVPVSVLCEDLVEAMTSSIGLGKPKEDLEKTPSNTD